MIERLMLFIAWSLSIGAAALIAGGALIALYILFAAFEHRKKS